jgi:DNA-binding response OmpR family regulator
MKTKVLMVEDQTPIAAMQQGLLEAYNGFEFVVVALGDHALDAYKRHRPALVLMDLRLPRMNGIEAIRQIRRLDLQVPIIVVTAYGHADVRSRAMAAGADDFFVKPFDVGQLHRRMIELIAAIPDMTRDDHIKALIRNKMRRLMKLEERQALLGLSAPAELPIEIEDLKTDIESLQKGTYYDS